MSDVLIKDDLAWTWYQNRNISNIDKNKCGKWMYFFRDDGKGIEFVKDKCREAVQRGIVECAKHNNAKSLKAIGTGVACFYLNYDDTERHQNVIQFLLDNGMIQKTKVGKLYNNSFKLDSQTSSDEYGKDYVPVLKLENFIDLETGRLRDV